MKSLDVKVTLGLVLVLSLAGCGQSSQDMGPHQARAKQDIIADKSATIPATDLPMRKHNSGDVRQLFIAHPKALLAKQDTVVILASNSSKQNVAFFVKTLNSPSAMVYGRNGILYFITADKNKVIALIPGQHEGRLFTHSPQFSTVLSDDGKREPLYGYLSGLALTKGANLLTIINDQDPYQIDLKSGKMSFISFVHPSGEKIIGVVDYGTPKLKNYGDWRFSHIQSDEEGHIVLYNGGIHKWQRYRYEGKIEEINSPLDLPASAYLVEANPWKDIFFTTLGSDGYIYAVEEGKHPNDPDRVIRIGDPGQSSLRKEASRVVIADFKHGDLTGALAFSPKGELAVGAKNAIYLISPIAAK